MKIGKVSIIGGITAVVGTLAALAVSSYRNNGICFGAVQAVKNRIYGDGETNAAEIFSVVVGCPCDECQTALLDSIPYAGMTNDEASDEADALLDEHDIIYAEECRLASEDAEAEEAYAQECAETAAKKRAQEIADKKRATRAKNTALRAKDAEAKKAAEQA